MARLILFNLVTLDGFFAGPNGEIDWHRVDDEFNEFAVGQLEAAGGLVFGRVTYELMAGYWPSEEGPRDDPLVAAKMNGLPKVVFSRTMERADWANTSLVRGDDAVREMAGLKKRPGKDLYIFGSADLAGTFTRHRLIDEYRLLVNPVVLGRGRPLFAGARRLDFEHLSTRTFGNGNVLQCYSPVWPEEMS
jgi:dihydrofolate reductase